MSRVSRPLAVYVFHWPAPDPLENRVPRCTTGPGSRLCLRGSPRYDDAIRAAVNGSHGTQAGARAALRAANFGAYPAGREENIEGPIDYWQLEVEQGMVPVTVERYSWDGAGFVSLGGARNPVMVEAPTTRRAEAEAIAAPFRRMD